MHFEDFIQSYAEHRIEFRKGWRLSKGRESRENINGMLLQFKNISQNSKLPKNPSKSEKALKGNSLNDGIAPLADRRKMREETDDENVGHSSAGTAEPVHPSTKKPFQRFATATTDQSAAVY